jgi:mannose-6-phosphate isomerase-like protein (cupin superfamily)
MQGYIDNIEQTTIENNYFRKVLYTSIFAQLVVMSLRPQEEIGEEIHEVDQFFRFESGKGEVYIDGTKYDVGDGTCVIVPAGAKHNVKNTSEEDSLKLYTLYCPPHHKDGTVHATKQDAIANEDEHFDGQTTEG